MRDFGLLFLRVSFGLMMLGHGVGKVRDLFAGQTGFPDPLGIGSVASLALAAFGEFLCALLVVLGVKTRWTTIPVVITMLVAAFIYHAEDGWSQKELPLLYAAGFLTLAFTGGGRYSITALFGKKR